MKNPSRDQLSRSLDLRTKHLMIRTLESFENLFSDLEGSRDAGSFKSSVRTAFNDVMRAQRDELRDYDVEYKPLHVQEDNSLMLTQTFIRSLQGVNLGKRGEVPYVQFKASLSSVKVMEALRSEIGAGVLVHEDDFIVLEINGLDSCLNCVLPILDRYRLHGKVTPSYGAWREEIVELYRRKGC